MSRSIISLALTTCLLAFCNTALSAGFPESDYTPFGYIDNPAHSFVLNRSGIIRSVPPLGFGFWARALPWTYGAGAQRTVNYLSFLDLGLNADGEHLHDTADFERLGIKLVSRYHTKTMMSYDWTFSGVEYRAKYYLADPNALVCLLTAKNSGSTQKKVTVTATNIYGFPGAGWWGSDGVATKFGMAPSVAVSKIWAYGDVFALGADRPDSFHKASASLDEWNRWIAENKRESNTGASFEFPGAMYASEGYDLTIPPRQETSLTLALVRGVNENAALDKLKLAISNASAELAKQLSTDTAFYANAPLLTGDWPEEWKHGWIYDLETQRMNFRPPLGIYKHPWDGMQIFSPRNVLGESSLDAMAMSYYNMQLAKESLLGTWQDAPSPNIPCSREDGSMNMICADGSEAGTSPVWGMPFHVIRSIYIRDHDDKWIRSLYPHLKDFLEWWLKNRTDKDGWFHSKCSWESGQDGSKRFLIDGHEGAVADNVRTVDIEAAMAEAFRNMVLFARVAGENRDIAYWQKLADRRVETTRAMYVDGWFRDFDARTAKPIILKDYWDVMMMVPLASGIASPEQMKAIQPRFDYFAKNPDYWLEWPSFMQVFTEAAWNAGQRQFIGSIVAGTADRIYQRTDARHTRLIPPGKYTFPEQYAFRIPGVATEYWATKPDDFGGAENYGWGATLPLLIVRNIIGFREFDDPDRNEFQLAPALPPRMLQTGKRFGITNLGFHGSTSDVLFELLSDRNIAVTLVTKKPGLHGVEIKDDRGEILASKPATSGETRTTFNVSNDHVYTVVVK